MDVPPAERDEVRFTKRKVMVFPRPPKYARVDPTVSSVVLIVVVVLDELEQPSDPA